MKFIKEISASETFAVRHPVLRTGKPLESCRFDGDYLTTTKHFGLFETNVLVGIITVLENKSELFDTENQFQIRGMAVLIAHQKKGFGKDLVDFAENYINSQNGKLIWFNARIAAVGFYEKLGFQITGDGFEIDEIGKHFVMFKENQGIM